MSLRFSSKKRGRKKRNILDCFNVDFNYSIECLLVCVNALHPSQQYFSHDGIIFCLLGLNQY